MHAYSIWKTPRKWIGSVGILGIMSIYGYTIKPSHSAGIIPVLEATSGYDLDDADAGEFSLLTYNVAGLPELISSAKSPRVESMKAISKQINVYDIVNIQEDFYYHRELYNGGNMHRFRTRQKQAIPFGDGLNTLSKYPVLQSERVEWGECHGADCFAAKGFLFSRIEIAKGVLVDVYNIHATASDNELAVKARTSNLLQLKEFIMTNSQNRPVVVMGDFNAHYAAIWDDLNSFYAPLGLRDAWVDLHLGGKTPDAIAGFIAKEKLSLTDTCESIDKIYFRNGSNIEFTPRSYKVENRQFENRQGQALSDHCAVSLVLAWRKKTLSESLNTGLPK